MLGICCLEPLIIFPIYMDQQPSTAFFLSKVSGLNFYLFEPAFEHPSKCPDSTFCNLIILFLKYIKEGVSLTNGKKIHRFTFMSDNHPQQNRSKQNFQGSSFISLIDIQRFLSEVCGLKFDHPELAFDHFAIIYRFICVTDDHLVPSGTIGCHLVSLVTIGYHFGPLVTIWSIGTSVRHSSGRCSGVAVRAVDCWQ